MTEESKADEGNSAPQSAPKCRAKRDIFRFNGAITTAINLEHVTAINLEGKKITFQFYATANFVELEDEAAAASVYEVILRNWAADIFPE